MRCTATASASNLFTGLVDETSAQRGTSASSLFGVNPGPIKSHRSCAANLLPGSATLMTKTLSEPGQLRRSSTSGALDHPVIGKMQSEPSQRRCHNASNHRKVVQSVNLMTKTMSEPGRRPGSNASVALDRESSPIMGKTKTEPSRRQRRNETHGLAVPLQQDELSMAMSRREILGKARWLHANRGTYQARGPDASREKEILQVIRNEVFRDVLAAVKCCRVASSFASALGKCAKASRQQRAISAERHRRVAAHLAVARPRAKAAGKICTWLEEIREGHQKCDARWSMLRSICLEAAGESCTSGVGDDEPIAGGEAFADEEPLAGDASRALLRLRRKRSSSQPCSPVRVATPQAASPPRLAPPETHHSAANEVAKQIRSLYATSDKKRRRGFFGVPACAKQLPQLKHAETCELTFGR